MAIKKICQSVLLSACLISMLNVHAQDSPFGQTFQINTRLNSYVGKPSWLLIIRDVQTGQVLPYLYDFNGTDNFWVGFTYAHTYQVTVSELEFGPPNAKIHNFCHLEDGILDRESFTVSLSGDLTPNRRTSYCHVLKYKNFAFPIVDTSESSRSGGDTSSASTNDLAPSTPGNATSAITNAVTNAVGNGVSNGVGNTISNILSGARK
jgi:hypothetical protein